MQEVRVTGAALLAEGETRTFCLVFEEREREAFVLRHRGALVAFLNECPHWAIELDLGDGHFYDAAVDRIYCKNHGALFKLPDGQCETGPCLGRSLVRLVLREVGDDVLVSA